MTTRLQLLVSRPLALVLLLALAGGVSGAAPALGQEAPAPGAEETPRPDGYESLGPPVRLADVGAGALLLATEAAGVYLPAPGVATEVSIRISGILARTEVRQRFHNPTDAWVEGIYVFPLPEGSAVDTLRMRVGERVIEGRIHEREEAAEIYRAARAEGRRASLVEQERPNLFTTSVANLGPEEEMEVAIAYQEELRYDGGVVSLRFPMVAAPRYTPAGAGPGTEARPPVTPVVLAASAPVHPVRLTVELDAGFRVERMGSASHQIEVVRAGRSPGGGHPVYRVELADAPVAADRDFVLEWAPAIGREPGAALFTEELDGETYALLMLMPPTVRRSAAEAPPREAVFVIDTSGSMMGESIEQARSALRFALGRLRLEDHFNVIRFDSTTSALFPESLPAGDRALAEARRFVDGLRADGGTEMLPALELALSGRPVPGAVRQVVFVTDGAVGNEAELLARIRSRLGPSRLFTVGIGSAPNGHFMRRAAEEGRGTFTYIGRTDDVGPMMAELFGKLESPVLTGLELDWGVAGVEAWPERLPDLYAGEPVVIAARLPAGAVAAGTEAVLRGSIGVRPLELRRELGGSGAALGERAAAVGRPGVAKLWARRKIAALSARALEGVPADEVRGAIVEVALRHHLVSQHTSLVAVDLTPARPAEEAVRSRRLPVALPAGWEAAAIVGTLPQGGTGSRLLALLGALLLALAGAAAAFERRRLRGAPVRPLGREGRAS